jgi:hypothetical protein
MLKRFLCWLGLVSPPAPSPRPLSEYWPSLYAVLNERRPDLIAELEYPAPTAGQFSAWLDRRFPRDTRWGGESPANVPNLLRRYLEDAT